MVTWLFQKIRGAFFFKFGIKNSNGSHSKRPLRADRCRVATVRRTDLGLTQVSLEPYSPSRGSVRRVLNWNLPIPTLGRKWPFEFKFEIDFELAQVHGHKAQRLKPRRAITRYWGTVPTSCVLSPVAVTHSLSTLIAGDRPATRGRRPWGVAPPGAPPGRVVRCKVPVSAFLY